MAAWRLGAAACAGAAASGAFLVPASRDFSARCDANEPQPTGATTSAAAGTAAATVDQELAALVDWLRHQGADVDSMIFKQSDKDEGRFGVYADASMRQRGARSWLGTAAGWAGWGRDSPIPVAAFPLDFTLTAANLAQHTQQGVVFRELMQLGVLDERTAVILHLAVERQRLREARGSGGGSTDVGSTGGGELAWLSLLPESFGTTLYFSELDMQWLRGTTLHKATRLRQKGLREAWARLQPAAVQLAGQSGLAAAPSFEDWVWANSIFWSRAIAFPTRSPDGVVVQEGIVPGLDFCNHASPSPCYWTVSAAAAALKPSKQQAAASAAGEAPPALHAASSCITGGGSIDLVCPRNALPAAGQEVTIDYGGKSNEELMFLYGFALEGNPDEVLTVMCPLPPAGDWDELLRARLLLLQQRGLRPQLHLLASDMAQALGSSSGAAGTAGTTRMAAGSSAGGKGKGTTAAQSSSGGSGGGSQGGGGGPTFQTQGLPEDVVRTLEVFVMQPRQVLQNLEAGEGGEASSSGGNSGSGGSRGQEMSEAERSGQCMAVLTTLVRLLELKVLEQEGQEGTGPLEVDQQLLAAAGQALPRNQRHALVYRMGQKELGRAYLAHAKRLLQQEMANLARLQRDGA